MTCTRPLYVWPPAPGAADRRPVFSPRESYAGARSFAVPCGACMPCRLSRSRDWSTRLYHESMLHMSSSFVTLTYSDEFLPDDYSVSVREVQLFLKRLRKSSGASLRYFACGEYGGRTFRPHYHLLVFGLGFDDKTIWRRSGSGHYLYRSALLERVWPFGHSEIGSVTPQSAGYVARYITKKVTGSRAADHYSRVHPGTGELCSCRPEFVLMSRRPGIGSGWFDRFGGDAFPSDFVIVDGSKRPVPRFYSRKLEGKEALAVSSRRKALGLSRPDEGEMRRAVVEEVSILRAERLTREYEDGQ